MNKYELWLSKQQLKSPKPTVSLGDRILEHVGALYNIAYYSDSVVVERLGSQGWVSLWVSNVNTSTNTITLSSQPLQELRDRTSDRVPVYTEPGERAAYRDEQRRAENHSSFRDFLGYGQGRSRTRRTV